MNPAGVANHPDYQRIETAIDYLRARARQQPTLDEVAEHVGLSKFHFQRLFRRWAGVSPKRFLQDLTVTHAKHLLRESMPVVEAAWESGLSGSSRLHDLFVAMESVTPGEYKTRGAGLVIEYGFQPTPFGEALVALTTRGVCALRFVDDGGQPAAVARLRAEWPLAQCRPAERAPRAAARAAFEAAGAGRLPLHVHGTNFQIQVWRALLAVPPGSVVSYGRVAEAVGRPGAARAVGTAVAANPVAFAIPCHRVLRADGDLGEYRWGATRKRAILTWERSHQRHDASAAVAVG